MSPTREQARAAGFLCLLTAKKSARAAVNTGQVAIPDDDCRDILYATTDGALWHHLVVERGWSDQRYAEWLAALWTSQFVSRTPSRRRGR